ncbi:DUF6660 family protein [Marinigracilibium pacificum]|uniref:DUF6660 family protein n=1 Tax=Marinigracilibium pacificum TaxID=2729599 RepID=UPI0038CC0C07
MKIIAHILIALTLILSFIPCDDRHDSHNETEVALYDSADHDHNQDVENCSPLCICNCCHSHLIINQFKFFPKIQNFNSDFNSFYFTQLIEGFSGLPLQPPRA